jgi:hypothetical protein
MRLLREWQAVAAGAKRRRRWSQDPDAQPTSRPAEQLKRQRRVGDEHSRIADRRGAACASIARPVTRRAVSITSRTEARRKIAR